MHEQSSPNKEGPRLLGQRRKKVVFLALSPQVPDKHCHLKYQIRYTNNETEGSATCRLAEPQGQLAWP